MIVKAFLTGWILVIVSVYAHGAALAGFCAVSSCNLSNAPIIPDVTLSVSPKSVVYLKLGSDRIVITEFPVENDLLKNLGDALFVIYVDCMSLKEQFSVAKDPDPIPVQRNRQRGR